MLAAGKGTRMRSSVPKVLHVLAGKPMLIRVLDSLRRAGFPCPTLVVGYGEDQIREAVGNRALFVTQRELLGTGDAARVGVDTLAPSTRLVLVVHGDDPLINSNALVKMLERHKESKAAITLLTTEAKETRGFGRLIRDPEGNPVALLQESELSEEQRAGREVHLGAYVFDGEFLRQSLPRLEPHPPKEEYYLTDLVSLAHQVGEKILSVELPGGQDVMGVNDLSHLEAATRVIRRQTNRSLMERGVTILDSDTTLIDEDVEVEAETVIYPFTTISGACQIGGCCQIGPSTHIVSSKIGARCAIKSSTIEESVVGDDVSIGPYAHLRPGTRVASGCEIGSHAEVKNSSLGSGTRMHHFSYVGDADVGADVNIGAGTVTMNYDGFSKYRTVIGDRAFIGSGTLLRAPVKIGDGAYTGAGSVVIKDVPAGKLAVGIPARVIKEAPAFRVSHDEKQERRA